MNPLSIPTRRRSLPLLLLALLLAPGAVASQAAPAPFTPGKSTVTTELLGTELDLWVYRPASYRGEGFVLLLHGASRAAEAYRDNASGFAERLGRIVVVPHFDRERFPNRRYQFGGVFREDGSFADEGERTFAYIPELVRYIRDREGEELPYVILGYSAGAQFLARMSAFMELDAERLVAMSPGSTLFPTREMDYGLGFGELPEAFSSDERIRRYLALPLTVAIGTADREMEQLPQGDAYDQGVHRYSRNLRWFNQAMDLAFRNGWDFNWRLVIAHGAGHPPPEMFDHPQLENALFGHRGPSGTDGVRMARALSNAAFRRGDVEGVLETIDPDYVGTAGNGGHIRSRDELGALLTRVFEETPGRYFVRTADEVEMAASGDRAVESGRWTTLDPDGSGAVVPTGGGSYTAHWRRVDGRWLIHAEVFVTLTGGGGATIR